MAKPFYCALALVALSGCPSPQCPDGSAMVEGRCADTDTGTSDIDAAVRADANADAFSVFDAFMPDAGNDAFSPDAYIVPDGNCGCSGNLICVAGAPGGCGCVDDAQCGGATPACDVARNVCVPCVTNSHCGVGSATPICVDQTCQACGASSDCSGATPVCDTAPAMNRCVGCLDAMTCDGTLLDACVGNVCVGCDDRTDCMDDMGLPACVSNTCRQCDTNTDCGTVAAAHCDLGTNTCGRCTADSDCTRFGGTPVCDEGRGVCVQCTGDTEAARCGANSCRRSDGTCTMQRRGILDACDTCQADSECITGRRCIRHVFSGIDMGSFCFLDAAVGGCGDSDTALRPYSTRTGLTSIDGVAATYCMPPTTTTCEGIRDTQGQVCGASTECGDPRVADGYCPPAGTGAGICTYTCGGGVDCNRLLNCGGSPGHCRP
jgi:hypothetical protein